MKSFYVSDVDAIASSTTTAKTKPMLLDSVFQASQISSPSNIPPPVIRCTSNASPKTFIPDDVLSVIEQYQKNRTSIRTSVQSGRGNFMMNDGAGSKREGNKD